MGGKRPSRRMSKSPSVASKPKEDKPADEKPSEQADGGAEADKDAGADNDKLARMRSAMLSGDSDILLPDGSGEKEAVEPNSVAASLARMRSAMLEDPSEEGQQALERRASRRASTAAKPDGAADKRPSRKMSVKDLPADLEKRASRKMSVKDVGNLGERRASRKQSVADAGGADDKKDKKADAKRGSRKSKGAIPDLSDKDKKKKDGD